MSKAEEWPSPAYAIRTPRVTLRAYDRGDVDDVHAMIRANVDALRPWMPWIEDDSPDRARRAEMLRRFRGLFDLGQDFIYGIFDRGDGRCLGGCGLHPRTTAGALEIGYWVARDRWGQGIATEVAGALTRVAFEVMKADRVEIRVAPENTRSLAVPRKLRFTEEGTLRGVGAGRNGKPNVDLVVFSMLPSELRGSPAAAVAIETERFA